MKRNHLTLTFLLIPLFSTLLVASINLAIAAPLSDGAISIVFDDNYDNQYDYAWPSMQQRGISGTFYIRTDTMETPGYMSYSELQTLQASGNEVASHSVTHRSFTSLSDAEIQNECSNSKLALETNGLLISNFAYPNGNTTNHIDSIVDNYYRSGRTAYASPYLVTVPTSQFRLPGFSSEDEPSELDSLKNIINQISSTNSWGVILFHNIVPNDNSSPYTTSLADFENFLDFTISKNVKFLTINQTLNMQPLTVTASYGTVTPESGLYELGTLMTIEAIAPVVGDGERYVWEGWSGSGDGSYNGLNNPATITLDGPVTQNALWSHEYLLTISSNNGEVVPFIGENWFEEGLEVNLEAIAPVVGDGERYVWEGWSGSGDGSYNGLNNPATIIMNQAITEIVSWNHQFKVLISQNGGGADFSGNMITINGVGYSNGISLWLDSGSHSFSFAQELSINQGKKYTLISSSGLTNQPSGSILLSDSGSFNANYKTQYYLDIISSKGNVSGSGWYNSGEYVYVEMEQPIVEESEDVRYVFSGWTGAGSGIGTSLDLIIVNNSVSIIASWQKQYLFVFTQEGLPSESESFLIVNSKNQSLPFLTWIDEGAVVEFAYPDKIQSGFLTEYILTSPSKQSILTSNFPTTITATYSFQQNSSLLVIITILAIIAILVLLIIFLRKKNII